MFARERCCFQRPSLNKQDFILLFGTLFILLTFTAQDVLAETGDLCDLSAPNCTEPGETCSQDSTCVCGPEYYEHNSNCNNKIAHGGQCTSSTDNVCLDPTTTCIPDKNSQTRCLCGSDFYYKPISSSSSCSQLDNLKVSGITPGTVTANSVTLTWRADNHMSNVIYQILAVPSGGQTVPRSVTGSQTGGTVTGLTPGTQYTFNVTSVLPADSYYPEKRVSVQSSTGLWTKIAHTGTCNPTTQPNDICEDANMACIISVSGGYRCLCTEDHYRNDQDAACNPLDSLKVSDIRFGTINTDSVFITWQSNNYIQGVTYEIQAVPNGGQTVSGSVTGSQTGGTVTQLTPGTQYTFNVTSVLRSDNYYESKRISVSSTQVWTKIAHAETCNPSIQPSDICEDANTACNISASGGYRCLCTASYYRNGHDATCNPLHELKVSSIQATQRFTNNVTLAWSANTHGTNVRYTIQPSGGISPVSDITGTTTTVSGLTPGTRYTFTIKPVLPNDVFYSAKTTDSTVTSGVWTKPAKPGAVTDVQDITTHPFICNITLGASQGQVSHYTIMVNNENGQPTGSATTFKFTSLLPGQNYSYIAKAYNGNGDPSQPQTGTLKTPAIAQTSNDESDDTGWKVGLGVAVSFIVILIVVIVLGVLWHRRKTAMKKEDRPYNDMDLAPRDSHDYQGMPEGVSTASKDPKRNEQIWMAGLNKNLPPARQNNGSGHDDENHYDTVIENQDDESVAVNNEENPYRNKPKEESPYKNSPKAEPPYVNSPKEEPPYNNSPKKKWPYKNSPKKPTQNKNVKTAGVKNDYANLPL